MSECFDQVGQITLSEHDCMSAALDGHEDEAQDYLDCANAAYQNYVDCWRGTSTAWRECMMNVKTPTARRWPRVLNCLQMSVKRS